MVRERTLVGTVLSLSVALSVAGTLAATAVPAAAAGSSGGATVRRTNLVSDQPGVARLTDPNLVNAWGLSHGPDTPLWVSDNGTDVSTLYQGAVAATPVTPVPLVVNIPGGAPTGQVFNDTSDFTVPGTGQPALFVFASENGGISAWNQSVSTPTSAVPVRHIRGAVYKGLALVHTRSGPRLLATNFHAGRIDVFNAHFSRLHHPGRFHDPELPRRYAPFNVASIHRHVFVTYARQDAARHDDVAGRGHGIVDVYTDRGRLVRRFATHGVLDSPWGMTIAPRTFGRFAGDLLIGNFGNGRIHAFNPRSGALRGLVRNAHHRPVVIDGLWALLVGDPVAGGRNTVWFSAGPDDERHGLLGTLRAR